MTKIQLTSYDAANLAAARRAGESRKSLWAAIRSRFGIPTSIKLAMDSARNLYVKGTDPRSYLIGDAAGRYTRVATDAQMAAQAVAPVQNAAPAAAPASSQFALSDSNAAGRWMVIDRATLLDLLRDSGEADNAGILPAGFPANAGADALVLDPASGQLYFRESD